MDNQENIIDKRENVYSFFIALIIFGNSFQYVLSNFLGINFNLLYVEIILFLVFVVMSYGILEVHSRVVYFGILVLSIFAMNFIMNPNEYLDSFFLDFLKTCIIVILGFCMKVNYDVLIEYCKKFSIVNLVLFCLMIIKNQIPDNDYMTFGFHLFLSLSFLSIYFGLKRKWKWFWVMCIFYPIMLIYSAKTCWYMTAILFAVLLYVTPIKGRYKTVGTLGIFIVIYKFRDFVLFVVEKLSQYTDFNSYALRTMKIILEGTNGVDILGSRKFIYLHAIDVIKEHPMFGIGIGKFGNADVIYPHNIFLDILVTFGVIGGTIILLLIGYLVFNALIKNKSDINFQVIYICMGINFMRLMTTHTFVCEPIFYLTLCMALNSLCVKIAVSEE